MLIDEIEITVEAGHGGRGAVAFNNNLMSLGPSGGTGGNGGDIFLEGVSDINALHNFRYRKKLKADDGENGRPQFSDGKSGKNLTLYTPVGTVVRNIISGTEKEITKIGERLLIAKGGNGGKGNFHFRSPKNTSPKRFQEGLPGERSTLRLELKLIADVGLVGLPNAGKSSLLNSLTKAKSKTANYPFTTLEPHLGAYYELIIADIPGLIEGASEGRGLGARFLRHIERTRIIFHLISAESDNVSRDYMVIKKELKKYNPRFMDKKEYLILTKTDLLSEEDINKSLSILAKKNKDVFPISLRDNKGLENIKRLLNKIKESKIFTREE